VYTGLILYAHYKNVLAKCLAVIVFFVGLWAFSNGAADISISNNSVLFWSGMALLAYMFFAAGFFNFIYFFIKGYIKLSVWPLRLVYLFSAAISILAFTPLSYHDPLILFVSPALVDVGPVILISLVTAHLIFASGYFLLLKNYKKMPERQKYQSLYIIVGSFLTILGAIIFTVILPMLGNANLYSTGPIFGVFLIIGISYAIFKYHLIDIKITISNLERKIQERTLEIRNLQQFQSRMMIDISHALQTPLTIIKSRLENLAKNTESANEVRALEKTLDEISKKTYDLIRLARLEIKEEQFNFENFSLSDLATDIAEQMEIICQAQNIKLICSIQKEIWINGDKKKIEELVNNLLSNAIKYSANKREVYLEVGKNRLVQVIVKDTGIGIAPEMVDKIFDKFYRTNPGDLNTIGTGVGLAICKKIANIHKAEIKVTSQLGEGSVFTVIFS
jgi:signal transduction histidine kinase